MYTKKKKTSGPARTFGFTSGSSALSCSWSVFCFFLFVVGLESIFFVPIFCLFCGGVFGLGTKDKGPRDQGTRDKGPRDQGPRDQGTRDQGTRDQGTRDQGTKGPGTKGPGTKGPRDEGPRDQGPGTSKQKMALKRRFHLNSCIFLV